MVKKIAITGPESTGKSYITENLAKSYNTHWVPEYAREYLNSIKREYNYDDILKIAEGQIKHEEEITQDANGIIFCDTELLVTKIWSEYKYGKCHPWILKQLETCRYDLIILCDVDLPWEYDPLREHPEKRTYFLDLFIKELETRNWNYRLLSGLHPQRLENAIKIVDGFLGNG